MTDYLEANDSEPTTVNDLVANMTKWHDDDDADDDDGDGDGDGDDDEGEDDDDDDYCELYGSTYTWRLN